MKEILSVQTLAEELAFDPDYESAKARSSNMRGFIPGRFYRGYSHLFNELDVMGELETGRKIVEIVESSYDSENETTLEATAALVARNADFLEERGVSSDYAKVLMLHRAVDFDLRRARRSARLHKGDPYDQGKLSQVRRVKYRIIGVERGLQVYSAVA